ncbi:Os10g0175500, partial [Oryza sativa Japonica Group]
LSTSPPLLIHFSSLLLTLLPPGLSTGDGGGSPIPSSPLSQIYPRGGGDRRRNRGRRRRAVDVHAAWGARRRRRS